MARSLLNKATLLFIFLLPGGFFTRAEAPPFDLRSDCDGIAIKTEVKNSTPALPKGSVQITVSGAETPIYYIFYNAAGQLLSKEFTSSTLYNIDPGTYYCSIKDGKGCVKKTEFKIE